MRLMYVFGKSLLRSDRTSPGRKEFALTYTSATRFTAQTVSAISRAHRLTNVHNGLIARIRSFFSEKDCVFPC